MSPIKPLRPNEIRPNEMHDIDTAYVSTIDKFLAHFDQTHPKSASQLEEKRRYERIAEMRDNPDYTKAFTLFDDMQD